MLFVHKKPKCINFNNYCTYGYNKQYLHKLSIMTPKATFEHIPCYLCRKAQLHPFEQLLHIWLLNHFLHKLHIITPKTTLEPNSCYICTNAQMHQFQQLLHIWLYQTTFEQTRHSNT